MDYGLYGPMAPIDRIPVIHAEHAPVVASVATATNIKA